MEIKLRESAQKIQHPNNGISKERKSQNRGKEIVKNVLHQNFAEEQNLDSSLYVKHNKPNTKFYHETSEHQRFRIHIKAS